MSMAAKLNNLVDKMSEANLQADGQAEKPAKGAVDLQEMEKEDSSPLHLLMWSQPKGHCQASPIQNISDFNRRIGGHAPTLSFLDGPVGRRYAVRSQSWTY